MDNNSALKILQVNTSDIGGGAENVAWNLFNSYRDKGYNSKLAVGFKRTDDQDVIGIPNREFSSHLERLWLSASIKFKLPILKSLGNPYRYLKIILGREDFEFPGTSELLNLITATPDILHCHNLHGNYFDLRLLPQLCKKLPTILTLHDAWMLSGHCAHSFNCDLWKIGCGNCPDLTIYPAIRRDATASNWKTKNEIFTQSQLYISTPCQWLMDKVKDSILANAVIESRIIPNGVNLEIFKPYDQVATREKLGLPKNAKILLFTANSIRKNVFKDFITMRSAVYKLATSFGRSDLIFIALGESERSIKIGPAKVLFIPYQRDPTIVSHYYQAADVYIHAANADTFPNTILESLACGTPTVATRVGGITEQIEDGVTGFLTTPNDADEMALLIEELLSDEDLSEDMGAKAVQTAQERFDIKQQVESYLNWYKEILARKKFASFSS
jgi:glycosyltransferase involved in cell wall biosynthesis